MSAEPKLDPIKQLEEEIKAIQPEEHPICPGCGEKHAPDEPKHPVGINIVDVAKVAGATLNNVPTDNAVPMIASFIGSFAESIEEKTWGQLLAHKLEHCGFEGCNCHIVMAAFLPELHKLKVAAEEGKMKGMHIEEGEK